MDRKRLCFVAHTTFTINNYLVEQLNALSEEFDVTVCCGENTISLSDQLSARISVAWNPLDRGVSFGSTMVAFFWFLRFFRSNRFDAIHSFTSKTGLVVQLTSWLCHVPLRVHTFTGQLWADSIGIRRTFFWTVDKIISLLSTELLTDSNSQREYLLNHGIAQAAQISVLGPGSICGVCLDVFRPDQEVRKKLRKELDFGPHICLFLYLGRKSPEKGVSHLLEAYSVLCGRVDDVALLLVGPDEMNIDSLLNSLSKDVLGTIRNFSHTEVPSEWMKAADVLCMPSYREGFGLAVIEAAACGIPAVVSDIYGLRDAVVPGVTAICVPPKDTESLTIAMEKMVQHVHRAEMGRAAREYVITRYDSRKICNAWREFYRSRLGR